MGVKIPATFEDSTGTIARLTGELEFDVPATPGEVLTANNPALTAGFAALPIGAGVQAVYTGNNVSVADAATDPLTFDTLASGTALLNITAPAAPTFLTAGTYAVSVVFTGDALTAAGYAVGAVTSGATGGFSFGAGYTQSPPDTFGASGVCVAAAGDTLAAELTSHDGASARNFSIAAAVVVKL